MKSSDDRQGKFSRHTRPQNVAIPINQRETRHTVLRIRSEMNKRNGSPLLYSNFHRVRPSLRYRRVFHPVDFQKLPTALLYRDKIKTAAKVLREDVTDLGSRRIVCSFHDEIRALPGEIVRFYNSKAAIFDQEFFRAVPSIKNADHENHA